MALYTLLSKLTNATGLPLFYKIYKIAIKPLPSPPPPNQILWTEHFLSIKSPRLHFQPVSGPFQCAALISPFRSERHKPQTTTHLPP